MSVESMSKCQLCNQYLSQTKEGRAVHMKRYHNVIVRPSTLPLTKKQMTVVVDRVHERMGRHNFIVPEDAPVSPNKKLCNKCGWTESDGYWLTNGTGICEPCLKQEAGTVEPIEEINYHD